MMDPAPETSDRLEEIRRLAEIAAADDRAAQAIVVRKRKVFGPLYYSTLVIAAIVTIYVGALRLGELFERQTMSLTAPSPESVVAANSTRLLNSSWAERAEAAKAIGNVLSQQGPGAEASGFRDEALRSLRKALADEGAPVRASAADAFANSPPFARMAKSELTKALDDDDPTVRLAAARALLRIRDDATAQALRTLSDLLTDPAPTSDRLIVLNEMRAQGDAGSDAAVKALAAMLSSREELLRNAALECMKALGPSAPQLGPAIMGLLDASDHVTRHAAAVAAARVIEVEDPGAPRIIPMLEAALTDSALPADVREGALQELSRLSWQSLGRCGRVLARQLDDPSYSVRLDAATLLHMIDPHSLADKDLPATRP